MAKKGRKKSATVRATPQAAPKRRRRSAYEGATSDRFTDDWLTFGTGPNSLNHNLGLLRERSRDLVRNYDLVNGMVQTICNNIVGTGFKFQAKVMMQKRNRFDEDLNREIEEAFEEWSKPERCDVAGALSLEDMEYLLWRSMIEAGQVFVRLLYFPFGDSPIPFALQVLEVDQLAEDYTVPAKAGENAIINGIEVDAWGRKIAYYFYKGHPYDFTANWLGKRDMDRIPASEIIDLYKILRPGQLHGVPWIHCSLITLQHARKYITQEVLAARIQNAVAMFIERPEGDSPLTEEEAADELEEILPGAIDYLEPGEKPHAFVPTRPNSDAVGFMTHLNRSIAAGQGLSSESFTRDLSGTNYSSARVGLLEERKNYKVWQHWCRETLLRRIYGEWLRMAVLSGEIKIPNFEMDKRRYLKHAWIGPGWDWVDPEKDAKAAMLELIAGLTTRADILGEKGKDIEEVMQQLALEKELAESLGLEFDLKTGAGRPEEKEPAKQLILPRGVKRGNYTRTRARV